jgi:hypothetical protein
MCGAPANPLSSSSNQALLLFILSRINVSCLALDACTRCPGPLLLSTRHLQRQVVPIEMPKNDQRRFETPAAQSRVLHSSTKGHAQQVLRHLEGSTSSNKCFTLCTSSAGTSASRSERTCVSRLFDSAAYVTTSPDLRSASTPRCISAAELWVTAARAGWICRLNSSN